MLKLKRRWVSFLCCWSPRIKSKKWEKCPPKAIMSMFQATESRHTNLQQQPTPLHSSFLFCSKWLHFILIFYTFPNIWEYADRQTDQANLIVNVGWKESWDKPMTLCNNFTHCKTHWTFCEFGDFFLERERLQKQSDNIFPIRLRAARIKLIQFGF